MTALLDLAPDGHAWILIGLALVQVTVVVALAGLTVVIAGRRDAAVRHATWLGALACVLLSPLSVVLVDQLGLTWSPILPFGPSAPSEAVVSARLDPTIVNVIDVGSGHLVAPAHTKASDAAPEPWATSSVRLIGVLALVIWGTGAAVLAVRIWWGLVILRALRRKCRPVAEAWLLDRYTNVLADLGLAWRPRLLVSDRLVGPVAVGIARPTILLPAHLAGVEHAEGLREILIHEAAHLLRRDPLVGLLQRLAGLLFWPHPLVHVLNRALARAREEVCDNHVLRLGDRFHYSPTLVDLACAAEVSSESLAVLGLLPARWRLSDRVAGLLDERRIVMLHASGWHISTTNCVLLLTVLTIAAVRPGTAAARGGDPARTVVAGRTQDPKPDDGPISEKEIAGRVVDAAGKSIDGALVQAYSWVPFYKTHTDRAGRFRLLVFNQPGMDPREGAEMRIGKDGYCPKMFESIKGDTADLVVTLTNKTYFEGVLTGAPGKPVANALIRASHPHRRGQTEIGRYWYETRTDAEGHYRLYANPETFDFQVRVPGAGVARRTGETIAADEAKAMDIALARGVAFRARVLDSLTNQPVAGVRLWFWQQPGIEGRSGENGLVTIEDMFPGRFEFQVADEKSSVLKVKTGAYARWWSEQCASAWNRRTIGEGNPIYGKWQRNFDHLDFDLQPGMEPVTIVVERAVTIRGQVRDPDGQAVAGATVAPALTGSGNSLTGDTRFSVESGADGRYEVLLPASGERAYNLVAHDGKLFAWRKWANGVLAPVRTQPGDLLEGIDILLTRPGIVRGRVVDSGGKHAADREVRASPADALENRYYNPTTRTDAQGRFELKFVRPGGQLIQVDPFFLFADQAPPGTSRTVTVKPGEVVDGVELIAQPGPRR
jgi:beta-lactamase regulating signal transducer with metallopeptidase domain